MTARFQHRPCPKPPPPPGAAGAAALLGDPAGHVCALRPSMTHPCCQLD